jgi:hypothetical protein
MTPLSFFRCAVAIAFTGFSISAFAQEADSPIPPSDPEAMTRRGIQLRREMRDAEALAEFRDAYAREPTPRRLAEIAFSEQALGQWVEAEQDLLATTRDSNDPWVAENLTTLRATLDEVARHLATVSVSANVDGAVLQVNGALAGPLPRVARVVAGRAILDAEAPGFERARHAIDLAAGAFARERLDLVPVLQAPSEAPPHPRVVPPTPSPARPSPWSWITAGGAAGLVVAGVAAMVVRDEHVSAYNDDAKCPVGQKDAVCGGDRSTAEAATVVATGSFSAAAALGLSSALLFLTGRSGAAASAWLAPSGGGAMVSGSF